MNVPMKKIVFLAIGIALLDQLTKWFAQNVWEVPWQPLQFLEFRIEHNPGIAWSIMLPIPLTIMLTVVLLVTGLILVWKLLDVQKPLTVAAIGLILGGALGNLVDRLLQGFVIDFIHLKNFTVFNLADAAIVVGIALLLLFHKTCQKK